MERSSPPRHPDHVLCWLSCFSQYVTACNYSQYLNNFSNIEGLSVDWCDTTVLSWKKGAHKFKLVNGCKNAEKHVLFTLTWIYKLVRAFDQMGHARISLFVLVSWGFLLRPLSKAFPIQVGDQRETCSLPDGKHSGFWIDNDSKANLRLLERKHRPRGFHMQRLHTHVTETTTTGSPVCRAGSRSHSPCFSMANFSSTTLQQR